MKSIKTVPITLDKERHLFYDVNALIDLGDALGLNLLTREGWEALTGKMVPNPKAAGEDDKEIFEPVEPTLRRVRAIVWAGLLHEDPTLTERQVGAMLNPSDLAPAVKAYTEAWMAQDVTESKDPNVAAPANAVSAG
jgi:hypothetical protein